MLDIETHDTDEAVSVLESMYSGLALSPSRDGVTSVKITMAQGAGLTYLHFHNSGSRTRIVGELGNGLRAGSIEIHGGSLRREGIELDLRLPQIYYGLSDAEYVAMESHVIDFDPDLFAAFATKYAGSDVDLDPRAATVTEAAGRQWRRASAHARSLLLDDSDPSPLAASTLFELAAGSFLDLSAPSAAADDGPPRVRAVRRRVDAAREYIRAHLGEPLMIADVASSVGMSVRALQTAFRSELDVTPLGEIRRLRLDAVRRELLEADPASTRVTDVARRWGFRHLGRFSGEYSRAYGEHPRDTLHS